MKATDVGKHWHIFVPALVRLAENVETSVRTRGLQAIIKFLAKCPPSTIHSTGMDRLFQNTILPTLRLLPALTPERDSVMLLQLGYQAALKLAAVGGDRHNANSRQLLDAVVRDGILAGYHYASDYVSIVDVLLRNMAAVVSRLGIFSTKHLAVSVPGLNGIIRRS